VAKQCNTWFSDRQHFVPYLLITYILFTPWIHACSLLTPCFICYIV